MSINFINIFVAENRSSRDENRASIVGMDDGKAAFLACSNAWLGELVNGKLLAILEAKGSRGEKACKKEGLATPE